MSNGNTRPVFGKSLAAHVLWRVLPLVVVVVAVVGVVLLHVGNRTIESEVYESLERQSVQLAERVAARLGSVADQADLLAKNGLILNGLIDTQSRDIYLTTLFDSLSTPGAASGRIALLDYRGREIVSNGVEGGIAEHWDVALRQLSDGETFIEFSPWALVVAVPTLLNGLPEGAIVISYPTEEVADMFDLEFATTAVALIDDMGRTLFSNTLHRESFGPATYTPDDGWIEVVRLVAFTDGLFLVVNQTEETALRPVAQLRLSLAVSIVVVLVVTALAVLFAAVLSTRGVRKLSWVIGGITRPEDFARRVKDVGPGELEELASAFNNMLESLQESTTSESFLDDILNSVTEVLIVTSADGSIIRCNVAARQFLAVREMDLDANIAAVIRADEYPAGQSPWDFLRLSGRAASLEAVYDLGSGRRPLGIRWSKSQIMSADGTPHGAVYVGSDISERIRVDKMKSEFVSTVSHELRTPLTSILGSVALIQSGALGEVPEKAVDLLAVSRNNCDRLLRLINDLLDVQKIEAGKLELKRQPLNLVQAIETAVAENASFAEGLGVRFRTSLPAVAPWIHADPDRIAQILTNLMSNAAKFSNEGDEVKVACGVEGEVVRISVRDYGIGIPKEYQPRIFGSFQQADSSDSRAKGGTGLGLAITKRLVDMHDGSITFESKPGEGTVFHVRFKTCRPPIHVPVKEGVA